MGFRFIYSLAKRYYHLWYYNTGVWQQTTWMGVHTLKSPMDMWNYQEIHGLASAFRNYRIRHESGQIGLILLVGDATDWAALRGPIGDIAASGISDKTKIRSQRSLVDNCVSSRKKHIGKAHALQERHLILITASERATTSCEDARLRACRCLSPLLSSHNLEHIANPIKALNSWKRVLKPRGFLLLVLPDKHRTFDYRRPITSLEHMRDDYARDMGEDDMTHVEEFVALWDYKKFPIANSIAEHRERYRNNFQQRLLHHHVFDLKSATDLVRYTGWNILAAERLRPWHTKDEYLTTLILFLQMP